MGIYGVYDRLLQKQKKFLKVGKGFAFFIGNKVSCVES